MTCPICREDGFWRIPFVRDPDVERWRAEAGDTAPYEWRLCRRCGNGYPTHQPDMAVLRRFWAADRADDRLAEAEKERVWNYRRSISHAGAARSFRLFASLPQRHPGRFLDIACGLGATVKIFADNGWDAEGIDADVHTAPLHRELDIRARIAQVEDIDAGSGYDIIHIAHAIYFITRPMDFIRNVRDRLAPGGVFCVVLADFMANEDPALPAYAHTFFPTGASMRYALALGGFELLVSKRQSGSIFMAARPASNPPLPRVSPAAIRLLYQTKTWRHAAIGRPYLALRRAAKTLLAHVRPTR